jgi:FkbM family methyltransferase
MGWVKKFRIAVDVGGHIGTWSQHLVKKFEHVHAFEPVPLFRQCFEKNVQSRNYTLYACALGSVNGKVRMKIDPADTGGTHVDPVAEAGDTVLRRLDDFELQDVDFIKIDAEGFEGQIVEGSRDTIRRCKPCIVVEQKSHKLQQNFGIKGTPAVDILQGMGYRVRKILSGDYILTHE